MTTADAALLGRLERYYDSVPRTRSRVEEVGPFTLFIAESGRPYYARPRLGLTAAITPDDVRRILARQREIGVPQAIEWVDETTCDSTSVPPVVTWLRPSRYSAR